MDFNFSSIVAEKVFLISSRIIVWISGYNSGKSWTAIQKALFLLLTFPGYRVAIFRSNATDLKRTTRQTFYKVCPPDLIAKDTNDQVPETIFDNGSKIYWMHIDIHTIDSVKSLEVNMIIYDQGEDLAASVYDALDARVGRWEDVEIPKELEHLLTRNEFTGKLEPPAYFVILANPPDEGEAHWFYHSLEPDEIDIKSEEKEKYYTIKTGKRVSFIESSSVLNRAINKENLNTLLSRDQAFIDRYVHGKRSQGEGSIHLVPDECILDYDEQFLKTILLKGALTRVLDYGSTSPTCCTWWANYKGIHVCYREYYQPNKLISYHRREIAHLSNGEYYVGNYADPQCFKKDQQAKGGRFSIADEFLDESLYCERPQDAPPIIFIPADNNEFATRNRINELLQLSNKNVHPINGRIPAPGVYFMKQSKEYPNGCNHIIRETKSQKKELLDTINGQPIYSNERDKNVVDHAYDTFRYYISIHQMPGFELKTKPHYMAFKEVLKRVKAKKLYDERMAG